MEFVQLVFIMRRFSMLIGRNALRYFKIYYQAIQEKKVNITIVLLVLVEVKIVQGKPYFYEIN